MKHIHWLLLWLFMASINAAAQAPAIEWQHAYGKRSTAGLQAICQTRDGGYITAGSQDPLLGITQTYNFWIVKLDAAGNMQWQKQYGGSQPDDAASILQTMDGGYIVGGATASKDGDVTGSHNPSDAWILKLDSTGNIQWKKCYGGSVYVFGDRSSRILQLPDSSYMVAGSSTSNDGDLAGTRMPISWANGNAWLFKLDPQGNTIWKQTYGGTGNDEAQDICAMPDGGFIVAGHTNSNDMDVSGNHGHIDCWVFRIDAAGNILWQKNLGGTQNEMANKLILTKDGSIVFTGHTMSADGDVTGFHGGYYDTWVVKLDSSHGNILWQKTLGGSDFDLGKALVEQNGNIVVASVTRSRDGDITNPFGKEDIWLAALDNSTGNLIWQKSFGGSGQDGIFSVLYRYGIGLINTADGGLAFAAMTGSNNIPGFVESWDGYVVKLRKPLCDTIIALHDTSLCAAKPFLLMLQPTVTGLNYIWNNNAQTPAITVQDTGTYWRNAVSGCSLLVDTFYLRHAMNIQAFRHDTLVCRETMITLLAGDDFTKYQWSTGDTAGMITIDNPAIYWRRAADECRITTDTFIVRNKKILPVLDLGPDRELCLDNNPQIGRSFPEVQYLWSTGDTTGHINPTTNGMYRLTIGNGCETATDSVVIRLADCNECLFIPTAFTPNNDGRNDAFGAVTKCTLTTFRMNIFNRWGQQVFMAYHPDDKWNGLFNGAAAPLGTYFYSVTYGAPDGRIINGKGEVTLIR